MGTTAKGVWFPDASTPVSPLHPVFSTLASSVDALIPTGPERVQVFTTSGARDAAIPAPVNGQRCITAGVPQQYRSASDVFGGAGWYTENASVASVAFAASPATGTIASTLSYGNIRTVAGKIDRTVDSFSNVAVTTGFSTVILMAWGGPMDTFSTAVGPCTYEAAQGGINDIKFRVFARSGGWCPQGVTFSFGFVAMGY